MADKDLTINFLCQWDQRNRVTTWSGTCYKLFTALSEFANVVDVPLMDKSWQLQIVKWIGRVHRKIFRISDWNVTSMKLSDYQIEHTKLDENAPCIAFGDDGYNTRYLKNMYIYQDFTVDYLVRLRESNPSLSKYSPMPVNAGKLAVATRLKRALFVNDHCAGRLTMSQYLARDLVEKSGMAPSRVHHVGGGCNIDTSKIDTTRKNGKRFLFVGKNWELKNGPLVVNAFKKFHAKYSDTELYICGPSTIPAGFTQGGGGINFLGLLDYNNVREYFNLCDFFVMPSKHEGYGLVFPEALIFGLPCIGKNINAMPEFIQDGLNGTLINNDDLDELCNAMERLYLDQKNFVSYVFSKHDEYLQQYSWRTVTQRIINIMKNDGF